MSVGKTFIECPDKGRLQVCLPSESNRTARVQW